MPAVCIAPFGKIRRDARKAAAVELDLRVHRAHARLVDGAFEPPHARPRLRQALRQIGALDETFIG